MNGGYRSVNTVRRSREVELEDELARTRARERWLLVAAIVLVAVLAATMAAEGREAQAVHDYAAIYGALR